MSPEDEARVDKFAKRLQMRRVQADPGRALAHRARGAFKRMRFVEEFIADPSSASAAARRAGYKENSARTVGWLLMRDPEVKAEIERRVSDRLAAVSVTGDRLVREAAAIALVDPTSVIGADGLYKPVSEWPEDVRRAVSSLEIETEDVALADSNETVKIGRVKSAKLHSKVDAMNLLAKLLQMVVERREVKAEISGPGGGPIQVQVEEARKTLLEKLATLSLPEVAEGDVVP